MFTEVEHPVGTYLTPASPLVFSRHGRLPAARSPRLGEHTEEILAGLDDGAAGEADRAAEAAPASS
jgi:crotonobetainyl-CoA:carnitine CoA-transferase CaiB-like acyl-CoA transferase